jgi:hypothetical protein
MAAMSTSKAKAVGRQYVSDQVESDHFRDWYQDQLIEGEKLSREGKAAAGLETWNLVKLPNAKRLAARMLQQLGWDMDRDLSVRTIHELLKAAGVSKPESREAVLGFAEGVKAALKSSAVQSWLGDEIKYWAEEHKATAHGDMKLGVSGRRSRGGNAKRSSRGGRRAGRRSSRRSSRR